MRRRTRGALLRTLVAAPVIALVAACGSTVDPVEQTGPIVSVNPTSFTFAAGDSSTLTVNSSREGRVRWTSTNPAVVTVDSLVSTGDPARVNARAVGTALLNGVITIDGRSVATSVPVRVGAG